MTYASFAGSNLPAQFRYTPIPIAKRFEVMETQGGVAVGYTAGNMQVDPDNLLAWNVQGGCLTNWLYFLNHWNAATPGVDSYAFTGYWGDSFTVTWHMLDPPKVEGRVFDISGSWRICTVTSWGSDS